MLARFKWFKKSWGKYPFYGRCPTGIPSKNLSLVRVSVSSRGLFGRTVTKRRISNRGYKNYSYGRYL